MKTSTLIAASLLMAASVLATPSHNILVVVGAAGEESFAEGFEQAATAWEKASEEAGAEISFVGIDETNGTEDKHTIKSWIQNLDTSVSAPAWIVYIGHGTYNRRNAFLNLRGPDLSAREIAEWLPQMERTLVFIHGGSASSPFMSALSGPQRVIITATRSPDEINYARFGEYFGEVVASGEGDIDQDGQTSLLEAFITTAHRVSSFYQETGRLASEHALIDDNGDGQGTPPDWFRGIRVTKRAKGDNEPDGFRAHQIALIPSEQEKLLTLEQRQDRDSLEAELEALRKQKSSLPEGQYYDMLEAILLKLSKLYLKTDAEGNIIEQSFEEDDS